MAPAAQDTRTAGLSQAEFQAYIRAELRAAVRLALVSVLDAEMEALIGASRYERSPLRRDRRNGHYTRDLEACLAFYAFPASHWRTIRTTNVIERLFEEVKRRSHKLGAAFRNEDSCLLMFYAVLRGLQFKKVSMPN